VTFLIIAPYIYSYLLTYLLTYLLQKFKTENQSKLFTWEAEQSINDETSVISLETLTENETS